MKDDDSLSHLRMDKRLQKRRGWIEPAELEGELAKLPDLTHKVNDEPIEDPSSSPEAASERAESSGEPGA